MQNPIPLGAPIWADTTTPDLASDLEFYKTLFGWNSIDYGEEFGHYTECALGSGGDGSRSVAGAVPGPAEAPATWTVAFNVEDCVNAASAAEKLGAAIVDTPVRVGDGLVFAGLKDPDGAYFGLYEPLDESTGFKAYGEPGAVAWFEYAFDGAPGEVMQFYSELLNWDLDERPDRSLSLRTREGGWEFGGCHAAEGPELDLDPQWLVCFGAESVERTAASAVELGGTAMSLQDAAPAVIAAPSGARFGLVRS